MTASSMSAILIPADNDPSQRACSIGVGDGRAREGKARVERKLSCAGGSISTSDKKI